MVMNACFRSRGIVGHGYRSVGWFRRSPPRRSLGSENLLGHSPMAPSVANKGAIWGVDSDTAGGGVWAQSSAKRDKLKELLAELSDSTASLDTAASLDEKLDLELADGLTCLARHVDTATNHGQTQTLLDHTHSNVPKCNHWNHWNQRALSATEHLFDMLERASSETHWELPKYQATMNEAIRILSIPFPLHSTNLKNIPAGSFDTNSPLYYLRDFLQSTSSLVSDNQHMPITEELQQKLHALHQFHSFTFSSSTQIYRILILRATAHVLLHHWKTLTAVTSGDIDRAAVAKVACSSQRNTVHSQSILQLFQSYAEGNCQQWVRSWWNLMDADGDGSIDQEEMNSVVDLTIQPIHVALQEMLTMALAVSPVRKFEQQANQIEDWLLCQNDGDATNTTIDPSPTPTLLQLTWRQQRAELQARKILIQTFARTLSRHFRDQVETPHRLRCCYAWSEKEHQNNKIDSILVDASDDWGAASAVIGKKRYVELEPKISYDEFRVVQARHFPQLDKIGEEIVMSFKEDLWVLQGKRRQNRELRRDCLFFLLGVSLLDVGIGML